MKVKYDKITTAGEVCGVEYATANAIFPTGKEMKVTDRMSKFKLFEHLSIIQDRYNISEADIDTLLFLIKEDHSQKKLEDEID